MLCQRNLSGMKCVAKYDSPGSRVNRAQANCTILADVIAVGMKDPAAITSARIVQLPARG